MANKAYILWQLAREAEKDFSAAVFSDAKVAKLKGLIASSKHPLLTPGSFGVSTFKQAGDDKITFYAKGANFQGYMELYKDGRIGNPFTGYAKIPKEAEETAQDALRSFRPSTVTQEAAHQFPPQALYNGNDSGDESSEEEDPGLRCRMLFNCNRQDGRKLRFEGGRLGYTRTEDPEPSAKRQMKSKGNSTSTHTKTFAMPLTCDVCEKDHPEWEDKNAGIPNHKEVLEGVHDKNTTGKDIVHVCCLSKEEAMKRFPGKTFESKTVHDAIGQHRANGCL